jgi:hypothetical protein
MASAGAEFWDRFFSRRRESGDDVDWGGLWTRPFLVLPARELEPDYVVEEPGQTMHFFSETYLRELLAGWHQVHLVPAPVPHHKTGELFKHVCRGIARR